MPLRRGPRASLGRGVGVDLSLERRLRELQQPRGVGGVEVRAEDLRLAGPERDRGADGREHHVDPAPFDLDARGIQLLEVEHEVRVGEHDALPCGAFSVWRSQPATSPHRDPAGVGSGAKLTFL